MEKIDAAKIKAESITITASEGAVVPVVTEEEKALGEKMLGRPWNPNNAVVGVVSGEMVFLAQLRAMQAAQAEILSARINSGSITATAAAVSNAEIGPLVVTKSNIEGRG